MKNFKMKIAGILLAGMTFVSCNKWVDYDPKDDFKITDQEYFKSEADYRSAAVGAYAPLQWLNQIVPVGDIISDNSVTGGESASDVLSLQQINNFTHTPVNGTIADLWQSCYEGINRTNYMHQYKDKNPAGQSISFVGKDALYGEVYFLRAYYYFTLVKMFGGVPLFVERRLTLADQNNITRASAADVYKQIETDLTNAITVLPAVQVEQGRATKYAAQALLGKVYLYQNKFAPAAAMLDNVINSNAYSLVTNFNSIFLPSGENGPESVFEIQYSNGSATYDWGHVTRGQGNYSVQQCGVRGLNGSAAMPYNPGWSTNLPTQNLAAAYTAGDKRKDVTVLDIEAYKNANPALNITYQVAPYQNTGLYNQKYLPRKGETSGQVELNYSNNFRTIRYADVLLMAAEAYNKSGNDLKAQTYVNLVRRRAFGDLLHDITATGTALYDAILAERRLELAMEGDRFFDLVRTGRATTVLGPLGFVAGKHELFPIPQGEVDLAGLPQNPGY
ncbi:MAG: RagB/SusD family nutrient uptake outer membrane protein [Ferruginibacter sp.]|nr:RagB/SusD family nutrient uptake outer membrane protein [Ferruginibacter sp.]